MLIVLRHYIDFNVKKHIELVFLKHRPNIPTVMAHASALHFKTRKKGSEKPSHRVCAARGCKGLMLLDEQTYGRLKAFRR